MGVTTVWARSSWMVRCLACLQGSVLLTVCLCMVSACVSRWCGSVVVCMPSVCGRCPPVFPVGVGMWWSPHAARGERTGNVRRAVSAFLHAVSVRG